MPRLEPIPLEELDDVPRQIIEQGVADGLYATPIPLQIFAYRTAEIMGVSEQRKRMGVGTLLGGRIVELIRIRSAQLGECQPCMQSRKHDSITDDDVACLLAPSHGELTDQERMAIEFLDLLSADHHAIDAEFYARLGEVFTAAQIIELGFQCAQTMGVHRFIHTLDVYGTDPPVIRYSPDEVDSEKQLDPARRHVSTILVTGATGLTGANVCRLLLGRGDTVRALVRVEADAQPLADIGVELATGDVTDAASVLTASRGCDAVIHTAALLGGSSQDMNEFETVNFQGTVNVLDAAAATGMRRVVALSTGTFFDTTTGVAPEDASVTKNPSADPYTLTKMKAFEETMRRAAAGQDVVSCHPGAIYGPSPVVGRALAHTSFNRVLLGGIRGRLTRYLRFPVSWVFADDVAWGSIAALDRGVSGERYMLDGRPADVMSIAAACNKACAIAGVEHRVEDVAPSDDPELAKTFGPTLMSIATKERADPAERPAQSKTAARLGYDPTSLDDGLMQLVDWLKRVGRLA